MGKVPRQSFVPAVRLAEGVHGQGRGTLAVIECWESPFRTAAIAEQMEAKPTDSKCWSFGTGSGYQAAILSHLVKDVYTVREP